MNTHSLDQKEGCFIITEEIHADKMLLEIISGIGSESLLLLVVIILLLLSLVWSSRQRLLDLPPSPGLALPVVGHMYLLESNPRRQFLEWGQKYGPMVSFYFGNQLAIVLYGFDIIKEAFVKNAETFSDRPKTFVTQALGKDRGFVTSGSHWREQRKVSIEILRDLGLGKSVMEDKVQEEVTRYLANIDKQKGAAFDPREITMQSVSNIVSSLVFGKGFRHNDPEMARCARLIGEQVSLLEGTVILNFLPFLRVLPGDPFRFHKVLNIANHLEQGLIRQQLELRRQDISQGGEEEGEVHDFMCGYLKEMQTQKESGNKHSEINEENLIAVVANLFAAGTETTSTTLCWAMLYLLHHPKVSERCYQEIVTHVGLDRPPCIRDRQNLKYIEATVMEVQRISSIAPFSLHHTASSDIRLKNCFIPKGTIIMPSLDSVLLSEDIWEDPLIFRPERFFDKDGINLVKREELIPFSIGRRSCLGEALAKMELFLFLSAAIQKYQFCLPDGVNLPPIKDRFGLSCSPLPYQICFHQR